MAAAGWREDIVHRTGQPMVERLQRELQRKTQGRDAQRRDLLHPGRSQDPDRALAPALQHRKAALITQLQAAGTTDDLAADGQIALPSNRPGSLIETGPLIWGRSHTSSEVQAPANLGPVLHKLTRLICGFVKIENKDSNGAADSFRGPRLPS